MKFKRIASFIIDYYIILLFSFLIILFLCVIGLFFNFNLLNDFNLVINYIVVPISLIGLLFKDMIFKDASIGKKIFKIKVFSAISSEPHYYQLILRNLFLIVWPVEAILLIITNNRLGDIFLRTGVDKE